MTVLTSLLDNPRFVMAKVTCWGNMARDAGFAFAQHSYFLISHQSKPSKSALLLFNTIFLILDFEEIRFSAENQSKQEQIGLELIKWICPLLNTHHKSVGV